MIQLSEGSAERKTVSAASGPVGGIQTAEIRITVPCGADRYVFIPACCYAGNQFRVQLGKYPPMFRPEEARPEMPTVITDVPRLNPDGSGKIEVASGDAAVPCAGVFSEKEQRGVLVFTVQQIGGKNIGIAVEAGEIRLTWPARREQLYRSFRMIPNPEPWTDEPAEIPCRVLDFPCRSLAEFFRVFFENRKIMGMDAERPEVLPFSAQAAVLKDKFNRMNWDSRLRIYTVGTEENRFQTWQPGWVGGAMSGYALMKLGGGLEWQREMDTLSFLFSTQTESGFFRGVADRNGICYGDGFNLPGTEHWHLIRKSADVFYFLFKHFSLMKEHGMAVPQSFSDGARKTADGFVRLWRENGQFGQFADDSTGEIRVGGSASAAIAPAGLALASQYFAEPVYLKTAEESAQFYYRNFLRRGYTTGGPGEILQCPDSESAFGLLESFVVLHERTGEEAWLKCAKECAEFCSSWVAAYNYRFPEKSEFGRRGVKTVGSVFANVQNKHSAPGICTLSGDSLWKLWNRTGDPLYRELAEDVTLTIGQYMSTDASPIYDWNLTPEQRAGGDRALLEAHRLPQGYLCERVNLSDWEGENRVGGVFLGSCWPETSSLLALAEAVPLYEREQENG